jgi:hypothetical protein
MDLREIGWKGVDWRSLAKISKKLGVQEKKL